MKTALVVVDVQNDFCEGGSLAVAGGSEVAYNIATYATLGYEDYVVFTKDYHLPPPSTNGGHFALNGNEPDYVDTWPVHCVQGTKGARFHPNIQEIIRGRDTRIFTKGMGRPDYSGFQGMDIDQRLHTYLLARHVDNLHIVGIAGDHCVRLTALDAVDLGYHVTLFEDMIASVGGPEATRAVIEEVKNR